MELSWLRKFVVPLRGCLNFNGYVTLLKVSGEKSTEAVWSVLEDTVGHIYFILDLFFDNKSMSFLAAFNVFLFYYNFIFLFSTIYLEHTLW